MKRSLLPFTCLFLAALILLLTACDPVMRQMRTLQHSYDIVSVELIEYDNPDQQMFSDWVLDKSSKIKSFDVAKMTVLETLDEELKPDFITELAEATVMEDYYVYDSPKGICLKLNYSNGDFIIISSDYENNSFKGFIGKYSLKGTLKEYIGSFMAASTFDSLVNNYFQEQV